MARLCIRIAAGDNAKRTQRGDVVFAAEDGHVWSKAELTCGQYMFIDVPGTAADFAPLLEVGRDTARAKTLDLVRIGTQPSKEDLLNATVSRDR